MLENIISFLSNLSYTNAFGLFILENFIIYFLAIIIGSLIVKVFQKTRLSENLSKIEIKDIFYSFITVILNSVVTFIGFVLWQKGFIAFNYLIDISIFTDTVLLLLLMDFFMYFLHKLAHHKYLFKPIHQLHHNYDIPNPMTLFILSPAEAFGFGALWIFVLLIHKWSFIGVSLYLALNVAFGTIGHLGVEPIPEKVSNLNLLKYISTSTFHFNHHHYKDYNYGFYTTIWDRIFKTLKK